MPQYIVRNYAMPTTAAAAPVTTGTAIKTMLQVATPSTEEIDVVAWGFSFDGITVNVPVSVELIETGAVAATSGTAHGSTGVQPFDLTNVIGSSMTLGTGATGFTFTVEGTITATRTLDEVQAPPTQPYAMWFPLGNRPHVAASKFLRVRVKATNAVGMTCWILWSE